MRRAVAELELPVPAREQRNATTKPPGAAVTTKTGRSIFTSPIAWAVFQFFYSNLQSYSTVLKFIKKYTPPWFTADKTYRRRSRRQHVQLTWPTAVRPPPTVDSMVWVARHLTAMPNATAEQW
jgi:hypothetical protein